MNMFGKALASPIVSLDAPNLFEATEVLTDYQGGCDDFDDKLPDSSAKNQTTNFSRSETAVRDPLDTRGTFRGAARPDSSGASLAHPTSGRKSEER
jgi:hypothetical protein